MEQQASGRASPAGVPVRGTPVTRGAKMIRSLRSLLGIDSFSFRGKVVLITGGSRGLGLVMARRLAAEGARLAIIARHEDELARAKEDLLRHGAEVLALRCDVRDRAQIQAAVHHVKQALGPVDVLINNAGVIQVGPMEVQTP